MARGNCTACHEASAQITDRLRPLVAPRLLGDAGVGTRLASSYMLDFIARPHEVKRGTRMPNVLHGLEESARAEALPALVAHLSRQRPANWTPPAPTLVLPDAIRRGETLYRTIGCAACHGTPDRERLARATHFDALVGLILDPLASHPSGLMPRVPASEDEARSIAAYLLEGQAKDANGATKTVSSPGLRVEYFERAMTSDGLPDDANAPTRVFTLPAPTIDFPRRDDEFGVRYLGTLEVPADGEYTIHLGSDDGSRLFLDGKLVIDHWGPHGFAFRSKKVTLKKGPLPFRLVYFEITVDNDLKLEWSGPGIARQAIPASAFSHDAISLVPPIASEPTQVDAALAKRGEELFTSLGCASCHVAPSTGAPKLADLNVRRGCLADAPSASAPDFGLDKATRDDLRTTVAHARDLALPLRPAAMVTHTLHRMGCITCHQRGGEGGPSALNAESFVADGSAELGDQGRLPPRLDGVGDKFRPEALAKILDSAVKVRPYMLTRMPVFGADALRGVAEAMIAADRMPAHDAVPTFSPESAQAGRSLVGSTGVSCITCHTFSGRASLGVPAVDLAVMRDRLRPGWFLAFIEHPESFSPGTRMTRFWMPGLPIFPAILGGDPVRQREAVWNYLSMGTSMTPPAGLRMSDSDWELTPVLEPMLFATFMRGVSPRTLCVGYTDLVHAAYDAEHARFAKAWRGKFMDAAGTWDGRAGQLCLPAGSSVIDLPPGDAVAILASRDAAWPQPSLAYRGVERDAGRIPRFVTDLAGLRVRESAVPALNAQGAQLRRTIEAWADADRSDVYMRIAVGDAITERGGGFEISLEGGARLSVTVLSPGAFVRDGGGKRELLVPVDFKYVENETPRYKATVQVDLLW